MAALKQIHDSHNAEWRDGRPAHYGSIENEYRLLREACGWIDFSAAAKFRFTGEDRKSWLQGQVSNDMQHLTDGGFVQFCILKPTGQIIADADLWALPDEYVAVVPGSQREATLDRLEKMLILEDVAIQDLSQDHGLISVQGPEASRVLGERLPLPHLDAGTVELSGGALRLMRQDCTGSGGWSLLFDEASAPAVIGLLEGIRPVGFEAWQIARLECGIPLYGRDMNEKTLVMEMGAHFVESHVNLEKGCYTGQEVVMRIHSRGHTNRTWMGLKPESPVSPGDAVSHATRDDVGKVTSSAVSPAFGPIAAATLRNVAAVENESVIVQGPDGPVKAKVVRMPIRRIE
ncbi:MAG: aminomethyl transferase family protein [Armatimonadetes bacterium]|nr:aminomethyl transferase family protein [Armatimonadota bacterium]